MKENFFIKCYNILIDNNVLSKCDEVNRLYVDYTNYAFDKIIVLSIPSAGHPIKPNLVSPLKVPKRKLSSIYGHAGLIHALAHIEFNAINLAIDACYRFQDMPKEYYLNWLEVAKEEVYHFNLLCEHMQNLGFHYGDFDAHNGLWEMAYKTEDDFIARMGLVPRTLEARGIDAVPDMQEKLASINDTCGVEILEIIKNDEIKHVAYGDKWFKYACQCQHIDYIEYFFNLHEQYNAPVIRGPFNRIDRLKAGFSDFELDKLYQRGKNEKN